jgi:hypothetical protein
MNQSQFTLRLRQLRIRINRHGRDSRPYSDASDPFIRIRNGTLSATPMTSDEKL